MTDTTTVCPQEDFADLVDRMDSYKRLYAAIEKLSDVQKRRVTLYYFGGLTYRQIAEYEGVSHKAVIDSVALAIEKLRQQINN